MVLQFLASRAQNPFGILDPISGSYACDGLDCDTRIVNCAGKLAGRSFDLCLQFRARPAAHIVVHDTAG